MKRRKKMSLAPGITSTNAPNVARPNDNSRHAASATTSARALASVRHRLQATATPTAANSVTTGSRPWSSSCPVTSQPSTRPP